jgi:hypothetical protein
MSEPPDYGEKGNISKEGYIYTYLFLLVINNNKNFILLYYIIEEASYSKELAADGLPSYHSTLNDFKGYLKYIIITR